MKELIAKTDNLGIKLPLSENTAGLFESLKVGEHTFANRFAVQPMEGCDCANDGTPQELTLHRYLRFAKRWFRNVMV